MTPLQMVIIVPLALGVGFFLDCTLRQDKTPFEHKVERVGMAIFLPLFLLMTVYLGVI